MYRPLISETVKKTRAMPKNKNASSQMTGVTMKRLSLYDNLLGGKSYFKTRQDLLDRVNSSLQSDRQISLSSLDKDLRALRDELESRNSPVTLRDPRKGYRYSEYGFSLYKGNVNDWDVFQMKMLLDMAEPFMNKELHRELIRMAEKITGSCITKNPSVEFNKRLKNFLIDLPPLSDHEKMHQKPLLERIESESTLLLKVKSEGSGAGEFHVIPLTLILRPDGLWLAGKLLPKLGDSHRVCVIPVADIQNYVYSNLEFKDREDFESRSLLEDLDRYRLKCEDLERYARRGLGGEGSLSMVA
jgi:hypothetical protein